MMVAKQSNAGRGSGHRHPRSTRSALPGGSLYHGNDPNRVALARSLDEGRLVDAIDALEKMGTANVHLDVQAAAKLLRACKQARSWDLIDAMAR